MKTDRIYFLLIAIGITFWNIDTYSQSNYSKAIEQFKDLVQFDSNIKKHKGIVSESLLQNSGLLDTIWAATSSEESYETYFTYDNNLNMIEQYSEGTYEHFWAPTRKMILYNENEDVIEYIEEKQEGQAWLYIKREEYDYDEEYRIDWEWKERWNNDEVTITVYYYTYDENLIIIEKGFFDIDVFDLYETTTLTLDSLGNITSGYVERIDYKADYLFQYLADNKVSKINSIGYSFDDNQSWVKSDSTSDEYEYDSSENLISREKESFSLNDNWWESTLFEWEEYVYNPENFILKELFYEIRDRNSLFSLQEYSRSSSYTYDSFGKLISKLDSSFYGDNNYRTENPPVRTSYNYDSKNRLEEISIEQYFNDEWIANDDRIELLNPYVHNDTLSLFGQYFRISYVEVTDVEIEDENLPNNFTLHQNYPNPFNPNTTIEYSIPHVASGFSLSNTTLKIYNILGKEVATLVNKKQKPGNYKINFFATSLPSGVYFYRIENENLTETKKLILMK